MFITEHSIKSRIDVNDLFEYIRDLKLNINEYEEAKQMLIEDIQNKDKLPDFKESVRKVLNYIVAICSDENKQEKLINYIQNKVS